MDENATLSIYEMARKLKVTRRTLYRWDEKCILKMRHYPSGRAYYFYKDYLDYINKN